jgi:glycosyltransferase involved in cell wall biosynthesis
VVSVVLPYRDVAATLREACESVLADEAVHELLLVDDGSRDGSQEVATSLTDPRVRHLSTGGRGLIEALNLGLRAASYELCARMDGDDVSLPHRVGRAARALFDDPSLAVVATRARVVPSSPGMERYVAWQNGLTSAADHEREIFVESPVVHPSVVLRRSRVLELGGYRDVRWAEDYDLWLRLIEAGHGIAKLPEILFEWRTRPGRATSTHPRYAPERFVEARAAFLAKDGRVRGARALGVWGAGKAGRRLVRELRAAAPSLALRCFLDIDPRKLNRVAQGLPILSLEQGLELVDYLLVSVAAPGARAIVDGRLRASGRRPVLDYRLAQ